jgi:hypothetical protein
MSVRSKYLTAFTLNWLAILAYVLVPAFAIVLKGWYFLGFIALALVGLWISFAFVCPTCGLSVAWRRIPFNGATLYGFSPWPSRRCSGCDEPLGE